MDGAVNTKRLAGSNNRYEIPGDHNGCNRLAVLSDMVLRRTSFRKGEERGPKRKGAQPGSPSPGLRLPERSPPATGWL